MPLVLMKGQSVRRCDTNDVGVVNSGDGFYFLIDFATGQQLLGLHQIELVVLEGNYDEVSKARQSKGEPKLSE